MLTSGIDIITISRLARAVDDFGAGFLRRIFTPGEIAYCRGRVPELAARFAAKEAASKALGVGMRIMSRHGILWHEVQVVHDPRGKPLLEMSGRAAELAAAQAWREWSVSLSHDREYAVAFVVALG